jgi:hypothetical protein
VEIDVRPEPPEPVRRAILAALESARETDGVPAWWRAGIAGDQDDSTGLPRSSDGADRA